MLGKSIKYEFGATARIFLPMYAVLLVMSCVARLLYTGNFTFDTPRVLITMLMVMLFTAVWVITLVIILRRFWTNLLGREGYLMHTLPVKPWAHVFSKMLVAGVWCLVGMIVSVLALLIMLGSIDGFSREFWGALSTGWNEFKSYLDSSGLYGSFILACIQFVLCSIIGCFSFALSAYAAMAIGQLVNEHRVLASVGAFFGINIVLSIVGSIQGATGVTSVVYDWGAINSNMQDIPVTEIANLANSTMAVLLVESIVLCVALFLVTTLILKKRLNLQ